MDKINVAVVCGGQSGEHEVSLASAASIIAALNPRRYEVLPVLVDKNGRWLVEQSLLPAPKRPSRRPLTAGRKSLVMRTSSSPTPSQVIPSKRKIDVVIPIIHGTGGEDGCLQGLLELAGIPYVGSGVLGSAIGMDKAVQKMILEREGMPVAPWLSFRAGEWPERKGEILCRAASRFGYPIFVKPANLGSSVGISKAHDRVELEEGIEEALRFDEKVVLEKGIKNAREIECAVIGETESSRVSVCGEIVPSNEFYDYSAKYVDGKSETMVPARLPKPISERIRAMAGRAFTALEAYGLARIDFLVTRGRGPKIYLNEINTLPGFTKFSMFPKLWEADGLGYSSLLDELIGLAIRRHRRRAALVRDYSSLAAEK
jgi:D-alanine-D-alanine ligase